MKHSSAAAFSMGLKYPAEPVTTNKLSPSPDTYNVRPQEIIVPSTVFSKAPRSISATKFEPPGPGTYTIQTFVDITLSEPKGRSPKPIKEKNDKSKIDAPGPTSYNPTKLKTEISFSMGNKVFSMHKDPVTIGPGHYNPNIDSVLPVRSNTIGRSARETEFGRSDLPGPGYYEINPIKDSPKYTFGKDPKDKFVAPNVPSPGEYNIPGMGEEPNKKVGKTILPKRSLGSDDNNVPGPGSYNAKLPKESPSFSVGKDKRTTLMADRKNPGPGTYSPIQSQNKSPGKTIGSGPRPPINAINGYPGPGAYESYSFTTSGPKYSVIGRKGEGTETGALPGPGHYEPDFLAVKGERTHAVIGTGQRIIGLRPGILNVPGPGTYESRGQGESPKWSFKRASKTQNNYEGDPGPGHYEITSTIPDVPKYLLTNPHKN